MNPVIKKILKILGWIVGSVIFLLVLVLILIQVPAVQNFAKNKIVAYVEGKIKTKVSIGKLSIAFPKQIVVNDIYLEDQKKDTLLAARTVRVDIALLALLRKEVNINYFELNGIRGNVYRIQPDTVYNFDYIVKAFASEDTTTTKDTSGALKIQLNKIVFKNILATFKDDATGSDVYFYLGNFETHIRDFDVDHLAFNIPSISIANIDARIHQYNPIVHLANTTSADTASDPSSMPSLQLGEIGLKNIKFDYRSDTSALTARLRLGEFVTHPGKLNLQSLLIQLKDIKLDNTTAQIIVDKKQQFIAAKKTVAREIEKDPPTAKDSATAWKIDLGKISFNNNEFAYDDNNSPKAASGMDYSHLHIQSLTLDADNLSFTPTEYTGNINQFSFSEQSGFNLRKLHTHFLYNDKQAFLENLLLQTDGSSIQNKIAIGYPSIQAMSKQPGEIYIDAQLQHASISVKDMLIFMPAYRKNMKVSEQAVIKLNTIIKGYVKDLSVPVFELSGIGKTYAKLSGHIRGLPDVKKTYYDITVSQLSSTKKDLLQFIPPTSVPSSIRLPDDLSLKGFFKGSIKGFNTQAALKTNRGNVDINGSMNSNEVYSFKSMVRNLDAGYLFKQDTTLGRVSLDATFKGAGLDMKKANADYAINILSAQIMKYDYKNLLINGNINKGIVQTTAHIDDPNLSFNLEGTSDIKPAYPAVQLNLTLDTANLHALHILTDTLNLHGHLLVDMPSTNPDSLVGRIAVNELAVFNQGKAFTADSLSVIAAANGTQRELTINTDALKARLAGVYKLTEFAQALQQTVNNYYHLPGFKTKNITPQNWELNATLYPKGLLLQFMPELKGSDSIIVRSSFNSSANDLQLSVRNGRIIYGGNQLDSLTLLAQTNPKSFDFGLTLHDLKAGSMMLNKTALKGAVSNNQLDFALDLRDKKDKQRYVFGGLLTPLNNNGIKFHLKPDSLLLDYNKWNVAQNNFIEYDSTGILVNDFTISNAGQSLSINSTAQSMNAPVKLTFKDFRIGTLIKPLNQDSLLLDGVINGTAIAKNITTNPLFTSDLRINDITYRADSIGNLAIKVNNEQGNVFAANLSLTGNNSNLLLNGKYYTGEGRMEMKLDLNPVNLAIVKPFAAGQLNDISGLLKGNININGTTQQPAVTGQLNFENAFITPTVTGERLQLSNEAVKIDQQGIHFNNFTLLDSSNNKAVINGDVLTTDFKNYGFNATLRADNFSVVNTPQKTNQLFYGKLNINSDIKLGGDMNAPSIEANLRVNKATDFTLVLPSTDPEVVDRQGVVRFVDKDHPQDTSSFVNATDTLTNKSKLLGMDVTANIETDSSAKFTVVIDERNGDALSLQGRADLAGGIDKSGKTTLTGNYELTNGSYQLSLSFLKRKFDIQRGSIITWTGDPTTATIDITATYVANTASIDLVEPQLAGKSAAETNVYKEKLPFNVNLHMTGELLKPIIKFDITLPEDELSRWPQVDERLQQVRSDEAELNKQVFALLLLNRFVGENPLQSSAGGSLEGSVRESASKILSDQLNQLAGNLIQGFELNFDLKSGEDYSTGQAQNRTDLNVGVSKKLLNDRLRVNVGSNFQLEGPQNTNRATTTIAGDVSVDYQVSKDGRYMVRGYRKDQYEGVIEGQVIETGVSFILTFDYTQFKELFEGKKEKKKKRKS